MPKLEAYRKSLPYSYALGIYPSMNLVESRPALARRLILRSGCEESDGVFKLRSACAEAGVREEIADKALARVQQKENCYAAVVFDKYECTLDADRPHVVLCQASDAGNLGSILRTCVGFGILNVAVVRPCADLFDPHVVRASMGAFFKLNARVYESFDDYLSEFSSHALFPFMLTGAARLEEAAKARPERFSLVFGNEQTGLPAHFQSLGTPVFITQSGAIDSLNLAAAAAVGIYAFTH